MDKALSFNNKLKWGMALLAIPAIVAVLYLLFWFFIGVSIAAAVGGAVTAAAILLALMPAISERLTQLKYSSFKATVAAFPIETLDGEVERGAKYLKRAYDALQEKKAAVEDFRIEVGKVEKDHPEDAAEAKLQLEEAEEQMAFYVQDYVEHEQSHEAFVKETARQKRKWKLANAGAKMRESLQIKDEFMSQLRRDTAFAAIQQKHADSIAHIKLSKDVEYMRKRMAEAKAAQLTPAPLTFDTAGKVVLPQLKAIDYADALERKAA